MTERADIICVLTHADGEAGAVGKSLRALLGQAPATVLLIDHAHAGLDPAAVDARVRLVRMAPSARATARNRALQSIARAYAEKVGWVWVLDPGDCPAPYAIQQLSTRLASLPPEDADLVLLPGLLRAAGRIEPLPGTETLLPQDRDWTPQPDASLPPRDRVPAALVAPYAASRLVRTPLLGRPGVRFADDQGAGDLLFATAATLAAGAIRYCPLPVFHRDVPNRTPELGHAALRDATRALAVLGASPLANLPGLRQALLAMIARSLFSQGWPSAPADHAALWSHLSVVLKQSDHRLLWSLETPSSDLPDAPWIASTLKRVAACALGLADPTDRPLTLSVVVPVHNDAEGLRCLAASLAALGIVQQLVVVDDASSPPIRSAFGKTPLIDGVETVWLRLEPDTQGLSHGAGAARNHGQDCATGSHVLFLDADDTALPPLGDLVRNLNGQAFDVALFAHTDSRRIAKGSDGPDEALDRALWADIAPGLMPRPMAPDEAQALCRISNYPWNKIWRRDFLTDAQVRATEIPLHNDIAPHWAAFVSSRRILVSDARCVLHTVAPRTAQLSNRRDAGRLHLFEALDAVLDRFQRDAERRPESTTYLGPFLDFSLRLCEWAESRLQDPQAVQELRRLKQTFLHRVAALPSPLAEALDAALTQEPALAGRVLAAMEDT